MSSSSSSSTTTISLEDALRRGFTTGLQDRGVVARVEIDDLAQDKELFNLFLLGMERLQSNDPSYLQGNSWSYLAICSIHGQPPIPWQGVTRMALFEELSKLPTPMMSLLTPHETTREIEKRGNETVGYCPHGTAIFLPWHRLYVAMLEQALMYHILQIAQEFEKVGKALYMEKVGKFRFPYWEPCRPRSVVSSALSYGLPKVLSVAKILVWRPVKDSDGIDTIRNPLYEYQFPTKAVMKNFLLPTAQIMRNPSATADDLCSTFFGALSASTPEQANSDLRRTVRCPRISDRGGLQPTDAPFPAATNKWQQVGMSDHEFLRLSLNQQLDAHRDSLYTSLARNERFEYFSCAVAEGRLKEGWDFFNPVEPTPDPNSLEAIHDDYHVYLGGLRGTVAQYPHPRQAYVTDSRIDQMTTNPLSSFDPVFWFHHCNIERLFVVWQCLWPEPTKWLPTGMEKDEILLNNGNNATYTNPKFTRECSNTPLIPFKKPNATDRNFWNSDDIRNWSVLGNSAQEEVDALKKEAAAYINSKYGWKVSDAIQKKFKIDLKTISRLELFRVQPSNDPPCLQGLPWGPDQPDGGVDIVLPSGGSGGTGTNEQKGGAGTNEQKGGPEEKDERRVLPRAFMRKTMAAPLVKTSLPPRYSLAQGKDCHSTTLMLSRSFDRVLPDHVVVDGTYRHWQLNYVVDKFAFNSTFSVCVFVGDFDENPDTWPIDRNIVLRSGVLATDMRDQTAQCENCKKQQDENFLYGSTVPLTKTLTDYIKSAERQPPLPAPDGLVLKSLEPEDVIPFLRRNLHWRVLDPEHRVVPSDQTPGFHVFVTDEVVEFPKSITELPVFRPKTVRVEITDSRPGGRSHSDKGKAVTSLPRETNGSPSA